MIKSVNKGRRHQGQNTVSLCNIEETSGSLPSLLQAKPSDALAAEVLALDISARVSSGHAGQTMDEGAETIQAAQQRGDIE